MKEDVQFICYYAAPILGAMVLGIYHISSAQVFGETGRWFQKIKVDFSLILF